METAAMRLSIGMLAAGLALAVLLAAPARAQDHDAPRTLSVNGSGEVRAQPDYALVTLGVTARQPSLEAARQQANRIVEALLAVTRELRVPESRVRSTRLNVAPEYEWQEPKRQRQFVGYTVTRELIVDLRDLDRLGLLLEKSVTAGANVVHEPVLDSSQRADLERQALALALEDARRNAEVLAKGVGMAVGKARTVSGGGTGGRPRPMPMVAMARAEALAPRESPGTYQTGELVYAADASVTFDLVEPMPK
jgi:uncharacterized protein YggE